MRPSRPSRTLTAPHGFQTVDKKDAPLYYALILAFFALSGIPIVLNTSFNLAGMPIVESPSDAISCFLDANPDLSLLVLDGTPLRRKASLL